MIKKRLFNDGVLDERGFIHLERAQRLRMQACPFSSDSDGVVTNFCGDWCPLFGEPDTVTTRTKKLSSINICNDTELVFRKFEDNRK